MYVAAQYARLRRVWGARKARFELIQAVERRVLVFALTLSATTAGGQAVTPLLELKVLNGADQPRVNEPVSFGIPVMLQNQLYGLDFFQVVDSNLQPVPRQFKVLTRWDGTRDDVTKPIRWALVSFNANVPPLSSATYYVALGGAILWGVDLAALVIVLALDAIDRGSGPREE